MIRDGPLYLSAVSFIALMVWFISAPMAIWATYNIAIGNGHKSQILFAGLLTGGRQLGDTGCGGRLGTLTAGVGIELCIHNGRCLYPSLRQEHDQVLHSRYHKPNHHRLLPKWIFDKVILPLYDLLYYFIIPKVIAFEKS